MRSLLYPNAQDTTEHPYREILRSKWPIVSYFPQLANGPPAPLHDPEMLSFRSEAAPISEGRTSATERRAWNHRSLPHQISDVGAIKRYLSSM